MGICLSGGEVLCALGLEAEERERSDECVAAEEVSVTTGRNGPSTVGAVLSRGAKNDQTV